MKVKIKGNLAAEFEAAIKKLESKKINKTIEALKEATPIDTGEAREGWRKEGKTIVNDVEHLEALNSGSSRQAPSHFIERTLLGQAGLRPNGTIVRSK